MTPHTGVARGRKNFTFVFPFMIVVVSWQLALIPVLEQDVTSIYFVVSLTCCCFSFVNVKDVSVSPPLMTHTK
jgi:hypothetical protein